MQFRLTGSIGKYTMQSYWYNFTVATISIPCHDTKNWATFNYMLSYHQKKVHFQTVEREIEALFVVKDN